MVAAVVAVDLWSVPAAVDGAALVAAARPGARHTSVSHTRGCSLLAAAEVRVGVDVEVVRARRHLAALARRSMTDAEWADWLRRTDRDRAFLQHWTRVEAYLKALGEGVRGGLRSRPAGGWVVVDLALAASHVGALAVEAQRPVVLHRHTLGDVRATVRAARGT